MFRLALIAGGVCCPPLLRKSKVKGKTESASTNILQVSESECFPRVR